MAYRICSECSNPLTGKSATAKTCSEKCRSARSRRLKKSRSEGGEHSAMPPHQKELQQRVRGETTDVARHVIEEEIRPVVRESITADTLKAIADMVALTPTAVAALQEDLLSEDATIRQRAYTLLMKYTVGHHAIVTPEDKDKTGPLHVHFNLPRPEEAESMDGEVVVEDTLKTCDTCGQEKPVGSFVANSDRCEDCYTKQQAKATELLNADD